MSKLTIALVGNANSGKTTLFNRLTGTYQKTGNWTGVTVEEKQGVCKFDKDITIVDLPGIYSLYCKSKDEKVVIDYLTTNKVDVIINVVDGTNLERNLFLTTQLCELGIPMVLAVNMYDQLQKNGFRLNVDVLERTFNVGVVPISALKGTNVDKLISKSRQVKNAPKSLNLSRKEQEEQIKLRYEFIESNISKIISAKSTKSERVTQKIDNVLTHKFFGIPIFFLVVLLMYFLSIKVGGLLGGYIQECFNFLSNATLISLSRINTSTWICSLVCDGIINGVGVVISFLPQILILFMVMSIIEQSGYASRIAFILDRFFRIFGLNGKSFIPMIVASGCTVTGLMATRIVEDKGERRLTLYLLPFMPCGAKMLVFAFISSKFFYSSALVASSMYFLSIFCIAVCGRILKNTKSFKDSRGSFILEMPNLRFPSIKDVLFVLLEKTKEFLVKAGSIILVVSIVLWILENVGFYGYTNGMIENSFLYMIGSVVRYVFYPLGFGSWQASVSILSGIMAKEGIIQTLELFASDYSCIFYNGWSVYAFMAFILLSPPCFASIMTAKRELNNRKEFIKMLSFQTLTAYIVAFIINGVGFIIEWQSGLIFLIVTAIILLLTVLMLVFLFARKRCNIKSE